MIPRNRSDGLIRCQWTYRIFRYMTQSIPVFQRRIIWTSLPRFRIHTFPCSLPHRVSSPFYIKKKLLGNRAGIRLCLTFWQNNRSGSLWDVSSHLVIRHRCRFLQFSVICRRSRLSEARPLPGMNWICLPGLTACGPGPVPPWRLAWEGPFLSERSSSSLNCIGDGCAFRNTTYHPSDYTKPSGEFGVPRHHPRFLEWIAIGAPESTSLLEMGLGMWLHSLSRDQAMDAALQLQREVCLMTTNLDVLDQYVLCLQGTASKILELSLGSRGFPSAEVAAGTKGPRVRRASVQMEAMGLWRPSLDPVLLP